MSLWDCSWFTHVWHIHQSMFEVSSLITSVMAALQVVFVAGAYPFFPTVNIKSLKIFYYQHLSVCWHFTSTKNIQNATLLSWFPLMMTLTFFEGLPFLSRNYEEWYHRKKWKTSCKYICIWNEFQGQNENKQSIDWLTEYVYYSQCCALNWNNQH